MVKARESVLSLGGVVECNTFTKIYLCALGQYDYDAVPAFRLRSYFFRTGSTSTFTRSVPGRAASWCRLSIIYAKKPFKKIPPEQGIDELFVGGRENADLRLRWDRKHACFVAELLPVYGPGRPLGGACAYPPACARVALKKAERWMLERFERSDGLGAIYPGDAERDCGSALPGLLGR